MIDVSVLATCALGLLAAAGIAQGLALRDLRALYEACSGRVMAIALHLLRDRAEAEDVVQETFLEVWRRAPTFDPARGSREAWALVIARSRALDRLRARGSAARAAERAAEDPILPVPAPAELAERGQERVRVREALASLPPEQREVIELAFFAGLSQSEIAARTGEPLGTVKSRVRLGMDKLAAQLVTEAS